MAIERTLLKRFTKALTTWFEADSTMVTLTGHTSSDRRIYVKRGNEPLNRPSLILDVVETNQLMPEVDGMYLTEVQAVAYADSRVEALDIAGEVLAYTKQNSATLRDAAFSTDSIRTKSIRALGVMSQGESVLDPTSVRRTERSDVVAPDRFTAIVPIFIVWIDTSA